jgi:hypothetical protein
MKKIPQYLDHLQRKLKAKQTSMRTFSMAPEISKKAIKVLFFRLKDIYASPSIKTDTHVFHCLS